MNVAHTISLWLIMLAVVPFAFAADDDEKGDDDRKKDLDQAVVGDTAVLLEQGELEIMLGVSLEDEDDKQTTELLVQIEYGVTDWLEVTIQAPYLFINPETSDEQNVDGAGDVSIAGSVSVLNLYPFLVSTTLEVTLPTGNKHKSDDLSDGRVIWQPSINIDLALGDFELTVELGGEFADQTHVFVFETTLARAIGEIVPSIGLEGSLDGDEKELYVVPGIGFPIIEDVELGIEVPIGLTHESSNWTVAVELTFEF